MIKAFWQFNEDLFGYMLVYKLYVISFNIIKTSNKKLIQVFIENYILSVYN